MAETMVTMLQHRGQPAKSPGAGLAHLSRRTQVSVLMQAWAQLIHLSCICLHLSCICPRIQWLQGSFAVNGLLCRHGIYRDHAVPPCNGDPVTA